MSKPNSGLMEALAQSGLLVDAKIELEFLRVREMETEIAQKANPLEELVDSALQNEAMRYEALSSLGGLWVSGILLLLLCLLLVGLQRGSSLIILGKLGRSAKMAEFLKGKLQWVPGRMVVLVGSWLNSKDP